MWDDPHDIVYESLATLELKGGKPVGSWMRDWTQEERTEKFFEFCRAYDEREDSLLKVNYQQFSHRLHWHECPFVDLVTGFEAPQNVLVACLLFSFTNEHWQTFMAWHTGRLDQYIAEGNRLSRSDLFQIYYPKGTVVSRWLKGGPTLAGLDLGRDLEEKNRPWTMMEFAKYLNKYFVATYGFRNAMYPCKNAARHVAMSHPEWVDPESFLHGGTGFFDGFQQVFDVPGLMSKTKYEIDENGDYMPLNKATEDFVSKMNYLRDHPSNPIKKQKLLNLEDKLCFFWKHMAIRQGVKHTTKQIPYNWVYPDDWSLKTGKYGTRQT